MPDYSPTGVASTEYPAVDSGDDQDNNPPKHSSVALPFIPAALDDAGLSQAEFRLFCHLSRRAGTKGTAWGAIEGMAESCRMNKDTVKASLRALIDRNMVSRESRPGRTSIYWVQPIVRWRPAGSCEKIGSAPKISQPLISSGTQTERGATHLEEIRGHKGNQYQGSPSQGEGIEDMSGLRKPPCESFEDLKSFALKENITEGAFNAWWNLNHVRNWRIKKNGATVPISNPRASLRAFARCYQPPPAMNAEARRELTAFAAAEEISEECLAAWFELNDSKNWWQYHPLTGLPQPIFDFKRSLQGFWAKYNHYGQ